MAIYRKGTAGLTENGVVTGVDTKWQDKLSLIRVGATMVFMTQPLTLVTISAIVSDTEMRAIQTDSAVVPDGTNYVILLHDSITVDGLAQDVAETLRYYQSKETVIEEAIEFFKDFDLKALQELRESVRVDADRTEVNANAAETSKNDAAWYANNASQNAASAAGSKDAAAGSASSAANDAASALASKNAAAGSATSASQDAASAASSKSAASDSAFNAKTSETNAGNSKDAAESSKNAAATSEQNAYTWATNAAGSKDAAAGSAAAAASSETNAGNSAAAASQDAKRAKDEADRAASANPDMQLKKANNLSDVASMAAARENMGVDVIQKSGPYTIIMSADGERRLIVGGGLFQYQDAVGNTIPIPIESGGTGETTKAGARNNLGLGVGNSPAFAGLSTVTSSDLEGNAGGIWSSYLNDSSGKARIVSRQYAEIAEGNYRFVLGVFNGEPASSTKARYYTFDIDGNAGGFNSISAQSLSIGGGAEIKGFVKTGAIEASGNVWALQNKVIGVSSQDGGNKNISMTNVTGDGDANGWVNLIQGNFYSGWWQIGGRRTSGANISHTEIRVNSGSGEEGYFRFHSNGRAIASGGFANVGGGVGSAVYAVNNTVSGERGCLIGGYVESAGWNAWRQRGAGMLIEQPNQDSATNVFKVVSWGYDWTASMDAVNWSSGGNTIRINCGGASYEFNHAGTATAVSWLSTSDIRLKTNLKKIGSATDKIAALVGYTYYKRNNLDEDEHSFYGEEAGIIAQDLEDVLPEAVYPASSNPECDIKAVNYNGVTALLVNGFNEQAQEIADLKSEVSELKALIKSLVSK